MAGITKAQAESRLTEYLSAESAVLSGQSYSVQGRALTRANLREIREGIAYWDAKVQKLDSGGLRVRGLTPSYDK